MAARSPPAACCCSLQQSNRPPVQRQLPSRAEPALRKKLNRVDVAEKRSAAEEDDFREETGDKEDCGNDRTLALPRTTRKRLTEEQSVLIDSILFPKTKEEEKSKLESHRLKSREAFFSELPYVPKASWGGAAEE